MRQALNRCSTVACSVNRHCERFLRGNTERPAYTQTGAGGKLGKILTAVCIDSKAGSHYNILVTRRTPCNSDAGSEHPLPSRQGGVTDAFEAKGLIVSRYSQANAPLTIGKVCERIAICGRRRGVASSSVLVIRRVKIREQPIGLIQGAVPIPAEPQIYREVWLHLDVVLSE